MHIILILILLFFPFTVRAADGIYVILDSGFAVQTDLPTQGQASATQVDTNLLPPALRIGVGYNHDFNSRIGIGLETGLGWYARTIYYYSNDATTHVRSETSEFLLTGMYHFNPQYDFFAKTGGVRISPIVSGKNAPPQDTKIAFEAALGAAYNINANFAVTLTYVTVLGRKSNAISDICNNPPGLNEILFGLRYTFI
jgi:opacity protein-like surface antigen